MTSVISKGFADSHAVLPLIRRCLITWNGIAASMWQFLPLNGIKLRVTDHPPSIRFARPFLRPRNLATSDSGKLIRAIVLENRHWQFRASEGSRQKQRKGFDSMRTKNSAGSRSYPRSWCLHDCTSTKHLYISVKVEQLPSRIGKEPDRSASCGSRQSGPGRRTRITCSGSHSGSRSIG